MQDADKNGYTVLKSILGLAAHTGIVDTVKAKLRMFCVTRKISNTLPQHSRELAHCL